MINLYVISTKYGSKKYLLVFLLAFIALAITLTIILKGGTIGYESGTSDESKWEVKKCAISTIAGFGYEVQAQKFNIVSDGKGYSYWIDGRSIWRVNTANSSHNSVNNQIKRIFTFPYDPEKPTNWQLMSGYSWKTGVIYLFNNTTISVMVIKQVAEPMTGADFEIQHTVLYSSKVRETGVVKRISEIAVSSEGEIYFLNNASSLRKVVSSDVSHEILLGSNPLPPYLTSLFYDTVVQSLYLTDFANCLLVEYYLSNHTTLSKSFSPDRHCPRSLSMFNYRKTQLTFLQMSNNTKNDGDLTWSLSKSELGKPTLSLLINGSFGSSPPNVLYMTGFAHSLISGFNETVYFFNPSTSKLHIVDSNGHVKVPKALESCENIDGYFGNAKFGILTDIAIDPLTKNVRVIDSTNKVVREADFTQQIVTTLQLGNVTQNEMTSLIISPQGDWFFVDGPNATLIRKFSAGTTGNVTTILQSNFSVSSISYDSIHDELYFVENNRSPASTTCLLSTLKKLDMKSNKITLVASSRPAKLIFPKAGCFNKVIYSAKNSKLYLSVLKDISSCKSFYSHPPVLGSGHEILEIYWDSAQELIINQVDVCVRSFSLSSTYLWLAQNYPFTSVWHKQLTNVMEFRNSTDFLTPEKVGSFQDGDCRVASARVQEIFVQGEDEKIYFSEGCSLRVISHPLLTNV